MTNNVAELSLYLWSQPDERAQRFAMYAQDLVSAQHMFASLLKKLLDDGEKKAPGQLQSFSRVKRDIGLYCVSEEPRGGALDRLLLDNGYGEWPAYSLIAFTGPIPAATSAGTGSLPTTASYNPSKQVG